MFNREDDRAWEPELLRVEGELLLAEAPEATTKAEDHLRAAIATARDQEARFLELRAATALARVWLTRDRADQSAELLCPIFNRFTEGFDAPDLRTARALLDRIELCAGTQA